MEIYFQNGLIVVTEANITVEIQPEQVDGELVEYCKKRLDEGLKQAEYWQTHEVHPETGEIIEIVDTRIPHDWTKLQWLREERNRKLLATDWTQLPDVPLSDEEREKYRRLRQELRDLPQKVDTYLPIKSRDDAKQIIDNLCNML